MDLIFLEFYNGDNNSDASKDNADDILCSVYKITVVGLIKMFLLTPSKSVSQATRLVCASVLQHNKAVFLYFPGCCTRN